MRELHSSLYCVFCGMKSLKPMREVDEKQEIKLLWPKPGMQGGVPYIQSLRNQCHTKGQYL